MKTKLLTRPLHTYEKLTAKDAVEIYFSAERPADIARRYGITPVHVWKIKTGKCWSRVTGHKGE